MDAIYEQVKALLAEISPYAEIRRDTKLLEEKILDSMAVFAFVTRLEDAFDITIPDEAIGKEHFATLEDVVRLVRDIRGESA